MNNEEKAIHAGSFDGRTERICLLKSRKAS